jgi:4'-phosphopantetheinyl transferase
MGIYRQIHIDKRAVITIWKITESEDDLMAKVNDVEVREIAKSYKAITQRMQYLASQLLLEKLALRKLIIKDENGKPFLRDQRFISISHDSDYVAIMVADYLCGVDLQTSTEKVRRIASKFLAENDCIQPTDNLYRLTIGWSAKEALYKVHGNPRIFFKEHIRLISWSSILNRLHCEIQTSPLTETYEICYQPIDQVYLCYIHERS